MKANELMIGDWIADKDGDKVRVENIINSEFDCYYGIDVVCMNRDGRCSKWTVDFEDAQPIPLNADIVNQIHCHPQMAIFWDDRRTKETGENWYELRICTDGDTALNMEIRYVHELQHALRLLGIEKEVVL